MRSVARIACYVLIALCWPVWASAEDLRIVASTFPMYQLLQQITQGRAYLQIALLIPAQTGCPHDYMMTPADMRKLEKADILLINGLGMEDFLTVRQIGERPLQIIDASEAIRHEVLFYKADGPHGTGQVKQEPTYSPEHTATTDQEQTHAGVNPHAFASPRLLARMALYLAEQLGTLDVAGAAIYAANAARYSHELQVLAQEYRVLGEQLSKRKIVTQHGVFDYLARDIGLEIVAVVQAHAGHEPSAAEILQLTKRIRALGANAIFVEPQYPHKTGALLARESGVLLAELDPAASGPENAPLDYTLSRMRANGKTLEAVLGSR